MRPGFMWRGVFTSSLNSNSVFLVWKQMAETWWSGPYAEREPFFNRKIWVNLGSDLRYDVLPRTWFVTCTFVNKIYLLKASDSEELIFILAIFIYLFTAIDYITWRLRLSQKTQSVSYSLHASCILDKNVFWSDFQDLSVFKRNYLGKITKSWFAVTLSCL